jgi:hypothetical protein
MESMSEEQINKPAIPAATNFQRVTFFINEGQSPLVLGNAIFQGKSAAYPSVGDLIIAGGYFVRRHGERRPVERNTGMQA